MAGFFTATSPNYLEENHVSNYDRLQSTTASGVWLVMGVAGTTGLRDASLVSELASDPQESIVLELDDAGAVIRGFGCYTTE